MKRRESAEIPACALPTSVRIACEQAERVEGRGPTQIRELASLRARTGVLSVGCIGNKWLKPPASPAPPRPVLATRLPAPFLCNVRLAYSSRGIGNSPRSYSSGGIPPPCSTLRTCVQRRCSTQALSFFL